MKPRTEQDWVIVLDAVEWFQQQLRQRSPEQVREWICERGAHAQRYIFCQRCGPVDHPHKRCPDAGINQTVMVRASAYEDLVSAFLKYGWHSPRCRAREDSKCDCGFDAAAAPFSSEVSTKQNAHGVVSVGAD